MSEQAEGRETLRQRILEDPEFILEDKDLMQALIDANERSFGSKIVDLRGVAMERMEGRLERLDGTHRTVIASAYENLSGTNLIHSAVLRVLESTDFESFLDALSDDLPEMMRVKRLRLILESEKTSGSVDGFGEVLTVVERGVVDHYITAGRDTPVRIVTLRQVNPASQDVYGEDAAQIQSEAMLKLHLGDDRLPALLIMGSEDADQFSAKQGTDLLAFFGAALERSMRRWPA